MKRFLPSIIIALFLVGVIVISSSVYILDETKQAIITEFGKPVSGTISNPGLHFKVPFIQEVNYFDKRFLEWDGDQNQIPTKDKKFIFVDTYARWQITDPLQYFIRLRDERGAKSRLDDILDGETRNTIASHDLVEIVRSSNRTPEIDSLYMDEQRLEQIFVGRDKIQALVLESANSRTSDLGIVILDFRIKRINYVSEVQKRVYERMISERERIAEMFRSEGRGEASRIAGDKDRELKRIESDAERQAQEIMGRADARAAAIYTRAYNKNQQSRDLYEFVKTLEAYERTFDKETSIILSTRSEFYRMLRQMK